nr:cytochrome b5-like [Tanacetum cinerariifolium]
MKNHTLIDHEYVNCPLRFDDRICPANLLPIHMFDFDVILGMDWLASHRATIDCYARTVIFDDHPGGEEVLLLTTEKDATEDFEDTGHSKNARDMMKDYYVGELDTNSMPQNNSYTPPSNSTTASKSSKQASGSSSTNMLTFVLPILIFALAYLYYFAKKEVEPAFIGIHLGLCVIYKRDLTVLDGPRGGYPTEDIGTIRHDILGSGTSSKKATLDEPASAKDLKSSDSPLFLDELQQHTSDVVGYITNVGRSIQQRIGSRTLDFYLANQSSSTQVFDDPNIPTLKELKSEIRVADQTKSIISGRRTSGTSQRVAQKSNPIPLEAAVESAGSSTIDAVPDALRSSKKRLCKQPSVSTPLKPSTSVKISISSEATSPDSHMSTVDRRLNITSGGGTSSNKATLDESASAKEVKSDSPLFLDELQVGVTRIIFVMLCRIWDVSAVTGRYLSTDMVVSDARGNAIHCSARSNVAHNFIKLKEGVIYCIKNFVVHPNKEEYRIRNDDAFTLEFNGATSARKSLAKGVGFVRHPFQLVKLDSVELTYNKYMIDKLYLLSSSSTQILDDPNIPVLKELGSEIRVMDQTKQIIQVDFGQ